MLLAFAEGLEDTPELLESWELTGAVTVEADCPAEGDPDPDPDADEGPEEAAEEEELTVVEAPEVVEEPEADELTARLPMLDTVVHIEEAGAGCADGVAGSP